MTASSLPRDRRQPAILRPVNSARLDSSTTARSASRTLPSRAALILIMDGVWSSTLEQHGDFRQLDRHRRSIQYCEQVPCLGSQSISVFVTGRRVHGLVWKRTGQPRHDGRRRQALRVGGRHGHGVQLREVTQRSRHVHGLERVRHRERSHLRSQIDG